MNNPSELLEQIDLMREWLALPPEQKFPLDARGVAGGDWMHLNGEPHWNFQTTRYRKRPPTLAEGHNQHRITDADLEPGMRLMSEDEVERANRVRLENPRSDALLRRVGSGVARWNPDARKWERRGTIFGADPDGTFAVPIGWKDPMLMKQVTKPLNIDALRVGMVIATEKGGAQDIVQLVAKRGGKVYGWTVAGFTAMSPEWLMSQGARIVTGYDAECAPITIPASTVVWE